MKYTRILITLLFVFFLSSCAEYNTVQKKEKIYYSSTGFALIYDEHLYEQKIVDKKLNKKNQVFMHSIIKRNSPIKIINPLNSKFIESKVYKNANFPKIFNIVISKDVATILELDLNNPYVEIIEMKKNKTFIAKEGSIFDEEKNVANTVPVNEVKMNDLTKTKTEPKNEIKKNFFFILVISDFYYEDTANNLKKELINKTKMNNISIKKINNKKYRLFVGPFTNFNALKTSYISLNKLGFENLNVYKE